MVTVTLDTAPPVLAVASPANGAVFSASPITLTGTATDASGGAKDEKLALVVRMW